MTALTDAMLEYASAIRGDWSDFDGRSERNVIESWVSAMLDDTNAKTLQEWREDLGICLNGQGHWCGRWSGHCSKTGYEPCNCPCVKDET